MFCNSTFSKNSVSASSPDSRIVRWNWADMFSSISMSSSYGAVSSLTTLATMSCESSLSSVVLMSWVGLTLSSKHVHRLPNTSVFVVLLLVSLLLFQLPLVPLCLAFSWHVQRNQAAFAWSSSLTDVELLQLSVLPDYSFSPSTKFSASLWKTTFPLV